MDVPLARKLAPVRVKVGLQVRPAARRARLSEAAHIAHLLQHAAAALVPLQGRYGQPAEAGDHELRRLWLGMSRPPWAHITCFQLKGPNGSTCALQASAHWSQLSLRLVAAFQGTFVQPCPQPVLRCVDIDTEVTSGAPGSSQHVQAAASDKIRGASQASRPEHDQENVATQAGCNKGCLC